MTNASLCHCRGYRVATWPYMALVFRDDLNRDLRRKVYDGMCGYCVVLVWYNFNGIFIVIQWDINGIYHIIHNSIYIYCISQHLGISFIYVPWDINEIYQSISLNIGESLFPLLSAVWFVFLWAADIHMSPSGMFLYSHFRSLRWCYIYWALGLVLDLRYRKCSRPLQCDVNVDLDSPQELVRYKYHKP